MTLIYKFKKERLYNGNFVSRPRILVTLHGKNSSIEVAALIDSGCDVTVIPEELAKIVGLKLSGKEEMLYAFRESNKVIQSRATLTFIGKVQRENVKLKEIPILIVKSQEDKQDEEGIVLGIEGIFDRFEINFKKSKNQICLKPI